MHHPEAETRPPRVCICIATFRRSAGLERLLLSLDKLQFAAERFPALQIVVVDNDPDGSALAVCERLRNQLQWPIRLEHEPRTGISFARNRAVTYAVEHTDFIAFIDDDEAAEASWLDSLLLVQRAHDADVVAGPVMPQFEGEIPAWMLKGGFFDRKRYPTGHIIPYAGTGNVLIRTDVLREMNPVFDDQFALSGGEDTHLFMRISHAGYKLVWADDAVVREWIPSKRVSARWLLQRAYRAGNALSLCELDMHPSLFAAAIRASKGIGRIALASVTLPFSAMRGRAALLSSLRHLMMGIGNLTGLLGIRYEEYRKAVGS